jgi:hydrogenase maturation protein HypF
MGLTGWVLNDSSGVTIEVQGEPSRVAEFQNGLGESLPPLAAIDSTHSIEIAPDDETRFVIRQSENTLAASSPISADLSICDDCLSEMLDQRDRRFGYPFINCTNCGPRFTIVEGMPYDRAMTTMKSFFMCRQCQREYDDPSNRRFHAQPNACAKCGPEVWFAEPPLDGRPTELPRATDSVGVKAIDGFSSAIRAGKIVAVKGIGGFHLVVDATDRVIVDRLRERKGRIEKPFSIMVADVNQVESFAVVDEDERRLLESRERPIVLLRKRETSVFDEMLQAVAPGNQFVGVMLPYSPLHHLLIRRLSPLVMTSGNLSDEPIARTNIEAVARLRSIADCFLFHSRGINVVCDDSVVRCVDQAVLPIRRSRGYAPLPVMLNEAGPSVLAVGGEIKSTFCVTKDEYAYTSQHIGDVENLETLTALKRNVEHFLRLFRVEVKAIAADLHPEYLSSQWAKELAGSMGVPLIGVQHHGAHAASLRAEHAIPADQPMIACCFDGTGYGTDGAIWGGEFMIAGSRSFDRVANLKYFRLPGGDASIKRPFRTALALLDAYQLPWDERLPCVAVCSSHERNVLKQQLTRNLNCVQTSSAGRLFDGVASMIGIRHQVTYEAQAAIELESLASQAVDEVDPATYRFNAVTAASIEIACGNLLAKICRDVVNGVDRRRIAAQFHHSVAAMVADVCVAAREKSGINTAGLTGGVFQNVLLLKLVQNRLRHFDFDVLTHSIVPPNDGGIALGQAIIARTQISDWM